jgi:hypothetical protein
VSDAGSLRQRAHTILRERRFHGRRTPGPFSGIFRWLGDKLHPVLGPLGHGLGRVGSWIAELWSHAATRILLLGLVLVFASLLSVFAVKRRGAVGVVRGLHGEAAMSDDPRELERVADDAERAGDYALALRLRFQAGVMRLQMNGRIRRGRTTTTRAIGRQLRLREFDDLGRTFDAVAYGGASASADDARTARENWHAVLESKAS